MSAPREPVDPDELAEEAPIDPTPQEVDEYRELIGDEGSDHLAAGGEGPD